MRNPSTLSSNLRASTTSSALTPAFYTSFQSQALTLLTACSNLRSLCPSIEGLISTPASPDAIMPGKVLCLASSADEVGGYHTGVWLEELAGPYNILTQKGFEVVIASTKGGKIPLDPTSLNETNLTGAAKAFQTNGKSMGKLNNSLKASDANVDDYLAFYIPGGHGVMADGVQLMTPIIEEFAKKGKVCAAVCHGPAALTEAKLNGEYLVKGKKVTVFSNSEEVEVDKVNVVPFLPEDRMKERGAIFSKGNNWTEHVVVDGKLITGQNPQSSEALGEAIAKALGA